MQKLTINGKSKNNKHYCPTCRNGKLFSEEQYFQTDMLGNNHKEHICTLCNTKYKQSFIPLPIIVENFIAEEISKSTYRGWNQSNDGSLTKQNASYHMIKIGLQLKEEQKMLGEQIRKYNETGICENHHYITSHPFKTAEGKFEIDTCPICMTSKTTYRGITYNDTIMNLVRYIAQKGIEFEKAQQVIVPDFNIRDIKEAEKSTLELPDFTITKTIEEPVWTIEELVW